MKEWKKDLIKNILSEKKNKRIIFVHTPKCGGTYTTAVIKKTNIYNKGHRQAVKGEGITFTVIRDPIKRFESLLNYRLGEKQPRNDWPRNLKNVYSNKKITLNEIISKMTDKSILGFRPFSTLNHWTKNVDICITIDELKEFIEMCGKKFHNVPAKNVSPKNRGELNEENKKRIENLFSKDIEIYKKWTQ